MILVFQFFCHYCKYYFSLCFFNYFNLFIFLILFTAMISSPESDYYIYRNPRNKNAGKFLKLSDFLDFAKGKDIGGVLLILEVISLH